MSGPGFPLPVGRHPAESALQPVFSVKVTSVDDHLPIPFDTLHVEVESGKHDRIAERRVLRSSLGISLSSLSCSENMAVFAWLNGTLRLAVDTAGPVGKVPDTLRAGDCPPLTSRT